MITCDGRCRGETEAGYDDEGDGEAPAICRECNHLLRLADEPLEEEDGECKTCGEEMDSKTGEVCKACQILWLVKNNSMDMRIAPYLQGNQNPNNGEARRE